MTAHLATIIDFIRYAASRFSEAGVCLGHGHDSPIDEATHLVLSALHLPPDLPPVYAAGQLTGQERKHLLDLVDRRIRERIPVAYLVGETWFAGMRFLSDERALVPRSPIAELIVNGFSPWLDDRPVQRTLDLCTGSGCIGLAMAEYQPSWQVDLADISPDALALARENMACQHLDDGRVDIVESDLFAGLQGRCYDLIVSNPPYVGRQEFEALPDEFAREPGLGLVSGEDGLDLVLRMLAEAPTYLSEHGLLIVEVGASEAALCECLPQVPFEWIEFETGPMGVFVVERSSLIEHADCIREAASRERVVGLGVGSREQGVGKST